ncbi:MAG: carbohydrate-binding family 9-like protein [Phycisphaerales bacterium]|nr:carbohydrate-binding family 9-like protein [Phycisphaerales bacterium]
MKMSLISMSLLALLVTSGCCTALPMVPPSPSASSPADLPQVYVAGRASSPPVIDGRLDEGDWQAAPWTIAFRDIEGDAKPDPRFLTRAKMLWDDEYFYVGADMIEPHVWGTLTKRDSIIYNDNDFEVFIDPDGDNHDYYELEVNALNTQFDLMLTKPYRCGGTYDIGWDIDGLKTEVDIRGTLNDASDRDEGWSMEIAIPWESLRSHANRAVPPRDGDQWPVNFSRVQWKHQLKPDGRYERIPDVREDNWTWTPQDAIDMHRPEYWGLVQFSDRRPGVAVFQPKPDAMAWTILRRLHHAAEQYRSENERWPTSLAELEGRYQPLEVPGLGVPTVTSNDEGFLVEVRQDVGGESRVYRFGPDCRRTTTVISNGA